MPWIALVSLAILASGRTTAAEDQALARPHHIGSLSSLNLGIRYSSLLQNRGVIFYRDFQIDPVVGLFFLDDRVEFLGDSIGYRDFVAGDWLRARTRLVSLTDKPLFPSNPSVRAGVPQRPDTYEWSNALEFFVPGYNENYLAEIDLTMAKDISQHHGIYFEAQSKFKIFDYRLPSVRTKIEPNLFASLGWGDVAHNHYFYGPSSPEGFNNVAFGLWLAFPEESDRYYPIVQIRRFETLGPVGRAEYASHRNEGWLVSFIATYGVLE